MKKGFGTTVVGIIIIAVFTLLMFYLLKGFWAFATFFAWGFLIIAAVVNHNVIIDYVKRLYDLLKRNILYGLGGVLFSVLLYPLVFFILMIRALGSKALERAGFVEQKKEEEEFSDYEVLDEEILDLKELSKRKSER